MALQATVLIPTHDHGLLLSYAARSALAQTVEDLEVFIIGDGVPDATREIVAELMRDERVRFFDNPKGPRHGELHRNAALKQARGEIVCYLSDDDLWFPEHVETMRRLLWKVDFAHALPLYVDDRGALGVYEVDLTLPAYRELLLSGNNPIPLSCGAHTLEMYEKLPHGWRTTPDNLTTDLYMWQQFLSDPKCRAASGTHPTLLNFPSSRRRDWTLEDRFAELDRWSQRVADPEWRNRFVFEVLDSVVRTRAAERMRLLQSYERVREMRSRIEELRSQLQAVQESGTWKLLRKLDRIGTKILGRRT